MMTPDVLTELATHEAGASSGRLERLLELRRQAREFDAFLTDEIAAERRRLLDTPEWRWLEAASDLYSVPPDVVTSGDRSPRSVKARRMAAYLMRRDGMSYPLIGAVLCRDHTTILHSVRAVEADPHVRAIGDQLYAQDSARTAS